MTKYYKKGLFNKSVCCTIKAMNNMHTKKNLEEVISYCQSKLLKAPKGRLKVSSKAGKIRYYQVVDGKELYLNRNQKDIVAAMQEKAYYEAVLKAAQEELKACMKIKALEEVTDYEQVFGSIPENRRNLIKPIDTPETEAIKRKIEKEQKYWEKESLIRKGVDRTTNLETLNGEKVRSKSEVIIADRLKAAGIIYYYEGRVIFDSMYADEIKVWFPDFQVFNCRTGEKLYWEHFGLMDSPDYCASCQYKLETYAKHGIIMGKNLIVTMESSKHPLNTEYIDLLINSFLK